MKNTWKPFQENLNTLGFLCCLCVCLMSVNECLVIHAPSFCLVLQTFFLFPFSICTVLVVCPLLRSPITYAFIFPHHFSWLHFLASPKVFLWKMAFKFTNFFFMFIEFGEKIIFLYIVTFKLNIVWFWLIINFH